MSKSDEGDDMAELWSKAIRSPGRTEDRRANEARTMSYATRRQGYRGEPKSEQLNMRVRPSFKKQLVALSQARRVSIVELIESAIEALEGAP